MKKISDLQLGDVYRPGGEITWRRVEEILPNGTMKISRMVFNVYNIPHWEKVLKPVGKKGEMSVEIKD